MNQNEPQPVTEDKGHPPHKVEVTVDGKKHKVRPGTYVVSDFKKEVKVDAALVLDQVLDGEFIPLEDSATIEIKGGEVFVSHVPQGGSA